MRDGTATRQAIERAALDRFVKNGIDATTMRDISATAQIGLGGIYAHFKTKDELAYQVFVNLFSEFGRELDRRANAARTVEDKLRALIGYVFEEADSDPDRTSFLFLRRAQFVTELPKRGIGDPFLSFREVIDLGIDQGTFAKQDRNIATTMVIGVINQLCDAKIRNNIRLKEKAKGKQVKPMKGRINNPMVSLVGTATLACLRMLKE